MDEREQVCGGGDLICLPFDVFKNGKGSNETLEKTASRVFEEQMENFPARKGSPRAGIICISFIPMFFELVTPCVSARNCKLAPI